MAPEQPNNQQAAVINNQTDGASPTSSRRFRLLWVIVIVVVLAVSGWLIYSRVHNGRQPYKYAYTKLDSYSIKGSVGGSGVEFKKPVEITKLTATPEQADLEYLKSVGDKKKFVSYIAVLSVNSSEKLTTEQLKQLGVQITTARSGSDILEPVDNFIYTNVYENWNASIGSAQPFTNATIKADAWSFDLSASDPSGSNSVKGEVIYAIGSSRIAYFFMVFSRPDSWQTNQAVWQQVVDSIRIDR